MQRHMLNAKLHRAAVTDCHLDYEGSLTVDLDLLDRVGMVVGEKIQVVNINNGARFETYLIAGERGSGEICVNGAAARLAQPRDRIIIITYALVDEQELVSHKPTVLRLNERNEIVAEAK